MIEFFCLFIFFILMIWLHCWSHSLNLFTIMNTEQMRDFIKEQNKKMTFQQRFKIHYLSYKYRFQDWLEKIF